MEAINVDQLTQNILAAANAHLSESMKGDCVIINSIMFSPLDDEFRVAIEAVCEGRKGKSEHLIALLETPGGIMETVERLVAVMRTHYKKVSFVIPNFAYSAGTVLALSGDDIYMDYYSVLGPIDPQYPSSEGRLLPGQGVLQKFNTLSEQINKAKNPKQCRAELAYLIKNFDPAQLFQIEQAIEHGRTLISEWLPQYKFKNWKKTKTKGKKVTNQMRVKRARKIAEKLGDAERWHSHGRGIPMKVLNDDIKLKIEDFGRNPDLSHAIRNYHGLALDYYGKKMGMHGYVHTKLGVRRVA